MGKRRRFHCLDCKRDTGKMCEHYVLQDRVWLSAHPSPIGMLCIGCLEKRLGRQLRAADFADCYVNDPRFEAKSARLLDRMTSP